MKMFVVIFSVFLAMPVFADSSDWETLLCDVSDKNLSKMIISENLNEMEPHDFHFRIGPAHWSAGVWVKTGEFMSTGKTVGEGVVVKSERKSEVNLNDETRIVDYKVSFSDGGEIKTRFINEMNQDLVEGFSGFESATYKGPLSDNKEIDLESCRYSSIDY